MGDITITVSSPAGTTIQVPAPLSAISIEVPPLPAAINVQPLNAYIGPPGPPGAGQSTLEIVQSIASTTWTLAHNLQRYPAIFILDASGNVLLADVQQVSNNLAYAKFAVPTTGTAIII